MSIRYGQKVSPLGSRKSSFFKKNRFDGSIIKQPRTVNVWTRPADWLTMPSITSSEQKIALLMPVFPQGSNFLAFLISGAYTVDWGDGSVENFAAGVKAQHSYDYADPDLNATVTSDGYKMAVVIITPQAGQSLTSINFNQKYALTGYVFPDTSPVLEIVLSCPNLTSISLGNTNTFCKTIVNFSGVNMGNVTSFVSLFENLNNLKNVSFIQIATTVNNTQSMFAGCSSLTSVPLFNTASVTSMISMFTGCTSLTSVPLFNTASVTSMNSMFAACASLTSVPLFNTVSVMDLNTMFFGCTSLTSVPLFNTIAVITTGSMFYGCSSLTTVPLFNTAAVMDMNSMFFGCSSLTTVPLFNTAAVMDMSGMFSSCASLTSVPLFNTAAVTTMYGMFGGCFSLTTVPLFNTAAVTSMGQMFDSCDSLTTVPLFNTAAVMDMSLMFYNCQSLASIPLFSTAAVTTMYAMFYNCFSLITVPLLNTAAVTDMSQMFFECRTLTTVPLLNSGAVTSSKFSVIFSGCRSLSRGALSGTRFSISYVAFKLSTAELDHIFTNLGTIGSIGQSVSINSNWGAGGIVNLTATTTANNTTISMASTTGLAPGMQITGANSPLTTTRVVTFSTGSIVTIASHGLSDGDEVSFTSSGTVTGIIINKIYYVVNSTTGNFKLASTVGGPALTLTGTGPGSMRHRTQIVSITPTSILVSRPMAASGTTTLSFRQLKTGTALLKGWIVAG